MHSMSCWFCRYGYTNRCGKSLALGTQQIDGGQAQFVRVPDADGTLLLAPPHMGDDLLVMMSDIFPTGYYGAMRAIEYFQQPGDQVPPTWSDPSSVKPFKRFFEKQPLSETVFVCIGCGIVGLCGILTASVKGVGTVFCVDSVDDRLEQGAKMGGTPLKLGKDDINGIVLAATNGRGADAVIESVGNQLALRSAFDLLRPCGVLSSVGFHQGELPFTALKCYQKNFK
jgi:threonine dehydrogenase-like Zn-dependent dehydrogenase